MTMPNHRSRLNNCHRGSKRDQDNHGRGYRDWRRRVHHDAKRAMVGIALVRVQMRHLDDGKQRQQGKAHNSGSAEGLCLRAPIAA
jgi:hypothetical protein